MGTSAARSDQQRATPPPREDEAGSDPHRPVMGATASRPYTAPVTRWIRTTGELAELVGSLAGRRAIALDTESDSLHHHREKVCLVQVGVEEGGWLVDPLAARDLSPLAPLLADPAIVKVLHGADYDVTTLKRDFGFTFANMFDTMVASRVLGSPEIGLQALLRTEFGIALAKDSQKDDWSRRPLAPTQEAYALADVPTSSPSRPLRPRWRRWDGWSGARGVRGLAALEPTRRGRDAEAWQKVKGAPPVSRQQAVPGRSRRDAIADRTDVPAFRSSPRRDGPRGASSHHREVLKGLSPRVHREAASLLDTVVRAWASPEAACPRLPAAPRPVVSEATRRRIDALRTEPLAEAKRLALDVSVVLPQRLLERVAEAAPRSPSDLDAVEGLRRWRRDTFGEALVRVASAV